MKTSSYPKERIVIARVTPWEEQSVQFVAFTSSTIDVKRFNPKGKFQFEVEANKLNTAI